MGFQVQFITVKMETNKSQFCDQKFDQTSLEFPKEKQATKQHKCESCGKSFSGAQYLKEHKIQEGHKDYKCASCGKSFSISSNLKTHINTVHERNKDYKCQSCGKLFSQVYTLKRHIHTCLLYTSPSPRDLSTSRMPSSA